MKLPGFNLAEAIRILAQGAELRKQQNPAISFASKAKYLPLMQASKRLTRAVSAARKVAFEVLEEVAGGAYASDALRSRAASLSRRDAGLAGQIVFGCLRYQGQLDFLLRQYSGREPESLDLIVKIVLRAAIFQLRYLDRIPAHAAVDDAVEFVKQKKRAASGLTNAVLRKVNRDPWQWPDLPTALSCPGWMLERWTRHFGAQQARNIAEAALREPTPYIRARPGGEIPPGVEAEPTSVAGCYRLLSAPPAGMRLHDISSQAIMPLLQLGNGMSYLDLCAAPGNKTLQALEAEPRLAVACDLSLKRLKEVPPACPRVVLDAGEPLPFAIPFDRVFVDAPCSGTGTLARNPEIKWRVRESDFARFRTKQLSITLQAARQLAPRGKLLYASCSLEQEENEDVIKAVLTENAGLRCEQELWRLPGRDEGDGFYAALLGRE